MGKGKRRRNARGHFCWCCGRHRPNERFGGRGHRDHVCRDCQRLPAEELSFRQVVRNMERRVDGDGRIRRKARPRLDPFLKHSMRRVREHAEKLLRQDAEVRAELREAYRREEEALERVLQEEERLREEGSGEEAPIQANCWADLPF
ncbi:MAG: hypothetical protein D6731_09935 [Planctomycetota bacterium]|nr:MAG: hypothetical protein D6731_09935 [Planctomycetota bacterium]